MNSLMPMLSDALPNVGGELESGAGKTRVDFPIERYAPFGELAETFKGQGWQPERWNSEFTEYKPGYGLLNSIETNDGKGGKGYFSIKVGNKNGVADLIMKDREGNMIGKPLLQGVNVKQINDYFTNYSQAKDNYGNPIGSNVNQRSNTIQREGTIMDGMPIQVAVNR